MSYYTYQQPAPSQYGYDPKVIAYRHLTIAMLISTVVVAFVLFLGYNYPWLYIIGAAGEGIFIFGLFFAALFNVNFSESTATLILNLFAIFSSITLGFLVYMIAYTDVMVVFYAFATTGIVVFGIYAYTSTQRPDVSGMYKTVLVLSIAFLIIAVLGIFFWTNSPWYYLFISGFGAFLFALYMYIDFARLERREFNSPAMMALWLFYDIIYFLKYILIFFYEMSAMNRR